MFYHRRLINHFLHINHWIAKNDARADLDMRTFQIKLSAYGKTQLLEPQFLVERGATIAYAPALTPDVNGFIGWLPYRNKQWPLAINKILFKRHIEQDGKKTPQYWLSHESSPEGVLIKPAVGSFGNGQRGPFRSIDKSMPAHMLRNGEFYEKFRTGSILKVWYWNERPICVEIREPLCVEGDGKRNVMELVNSTYPVGGKAWQRYQARRNALSALLAYQETSWDTIPPPGVRVMIDYLYGSSLYPDISGNANRLETIKDSPLERELLECGPIFYRAIPEDIRANTAFAVDGIIDDASGEVRWLEMNSNPMFPPDAYDKVLDSLCKE